MSPMWKKVEAVSRPDAESPLNRQQVDPGSVICYRMHPAKRMLYHASGEIDLLPQITGNDNQSPPCLLSDQSHSVINLEGVRRVALMVTPQPQGAVIDQAWEAFSTIRAILKQQAIPMSVVSQTVFVRRAEDAEPCRRLFHAYFDERMPATNFVVQPPCGGQALAIEAWALGGEQVKLEFPQRDVVSIQYDGLRWLHIAGVSSRASNRTAYEQALQIFEEIARRLDWSGASFKDVVRTWIYQGGITEPENTIERYRELNRARSDFFAGQQALGRMPLSVDHTEMYPASTGIGMAGRGLNVGCLALQTSRDDVRLQSLENPQQTSAFDYARCYSAKSPKFSRAMVMVIGDYATHWISGTASIVNAESVHIGDAAKQTEQTIDNIEQLIGPDNLARHGLPGAGASLTDLAKVRVYIKRREDYEACREICERRFGSVPAIYAVADVCRSDLLVEIEGVAFARVQPTEAGSGGSSTCQVN